jgi:hypothetical protein
MRRFSHRSIMPYKSGPRTAESSAGFSILVPLSRRRGPVLSPTAGT